MSRPPARKKGQATKEFTVADGRSIGDNDNIRRDGRFVNAKHYDEADKIRLTKDQAEFHMRRGNITLELPDFDDDDDTSDTAKAGDGQKADTQGTDPVGDVLAAKAPEKTKPQL